jgi:hypothetical protein
VRVYWEHNIYRVSQPDGAEATGVVPVSVLL